MCTPSDESKISTHTHTHKGAYLNAEFGASGKYDGRGIEHSTAHAIATALNDGMRGAERWRVGGCIKVEGVAVSIFTARTIIAMITYNIMIVITIARDGRRSFQP